MIPTTEATKKAVTKLQDASGGRALVDGFLLNPAIRYLPYRSIALELSNMEWLRRQHDQYNPRYYTVPYDSTVPIIPTDTLYYQIEAVPESWVYGFNLCVYPGTPGTVADFMIQLTDACNGRLYWSTPVVGTALSPSGSKRIWPTLVSDPFKIDNPGFLQVAITNTTNANRQCQLLIHCYEPKWGALRYRSQRLG